MTDHTKAAHGEVWRRFVRAERAFFETRARFLRDCNNRTTVLLRALSTASQRDTALRVLLILGDEDRRAAFPVLAQLVCEHGPYARVAEQLINSLPRLWVAAALKQHADPILSAGDACDYACYAEFFESAGATEALAHLVAKALASPDIEIRAIGESYRRKAMANPGPTCSSPPVPALNAPAQRNALAVRKLSQRSPGTDAMPDTADARLWDQLRSAEDEFYFARKLLATRCRYDPELLYCAVQAGDLDEQGTAVRVFFLGNDDPRPILQDLLRLATSARHIEAESDLLRVIPVWQGSGLTVDLRTAQDLLMEMPRDLVVLESEPYVASLLASGDLQAYGLCAGLFSRLDLGLLHRLIDWGRQSLDPAVRQMALDLATRYGAGP